MNFATLLGMGKSVLNGRGSSAYRETKRGFVPKFTSDKNPFAPKVVVESAAPAEPVATTPAIAPVAETKIAPRSRPMRMTKWAVKLNPFREPEPMMQLRRAEQSELSLDTIKVLQNDLSEADIERVPAKSRTNRPTPVSSTAGAWEILANAS